MDENIKRRLEQIRRGEVPDGYKRGSLGTLPQEWKIVRLRSLAKKSLRKNQDFGVKLVFSNSARLGLVPQAEQFDKAIANQERIDGYYIVRPGAFVYNPRISVNAPCGPINVNETGKTGLVSPLYTVFTVDSPETDNEYLKYYFQSALWYRYMKGAANYGVRHDRMNLTDDDFFGMPVPAPPPDEQRAIAEILSAQDKIIALKERLAAEKRRQKAYLMQRLLTGRQRLPEFSGEWTKKQLRDIFDTFSGGTPNRDHPEYYRGDIPWIKSGELNQGNIYSTQERISQAGLDNSSAKMVPKDTLLMAMYAAPTAGVMAFTRIDAAINQAILALIPKTPIDTLFIKESIANEIDRAVNKLTQGGGRPNFNASIIQSLPVMIPELAEQRAISEIFACMNRELDLLERDITEHKRRKKALTQYLLAGLARA